MYSHLTKDQEIMKKIYGIVFLLIVLFSAGGNVNAQTVDYKYHSLFMYNFTRYIKWPDAAIGNEFVIGILGKSPITEHLERMAQTKQVNGVPIVVKTFKNPSEMTDCHMLFLPENYSSKFEEVRTILNGKHTLMVSEKAGLAQKGSDINFIVNNGRWNFELNQASTDMRKLKVSGELSKFAQKIYTEI